jgi:hypothetical protein
MAWAKAPVALGTLACAACLAVATTLPVTAPVAEKLVKPVQTGVNLAAINFAGLDWLSAIPAIQALIENGDTSGLDSLNGIAAFLNLGDQGLSAFEESADSPGYAALSGLNSLTTGNFAGIDAFSALGATGPGDLASLDAIPAFEAFAADGNTDAFVPDSDGNGGYAALSGLSSYRDAAGGNLLALGGIDAFSALPLYATIADANATDGERADAIRGLAAFSAIPEYLGLPTAAEEAEAKENADAKAAASKLLKQQEPQLLKQQAPVVQQDEDQTQVQVEGNSIQQLAAVAPPADPAPAADPGPQTGKPSNNKQGEVRNGLSFKPEGNGIPLFGSGRGSAADNGIRGWGDGLKKLGLNGGPDAGAAAGGAPAAGGGAE